VATLSTRKSIRRNVGRLTGDMDLFIATASGTTTTLADAVNGNRQDNSLVERLGIFSAGTAGNLGSIVRVTANVRSTQTLTFTPAVAGSTAAADELELWNRRDQGVSPRDVNDLINDAIAAVGEQAPLPALDTETAFDFDDPLISVPAAWEAVTGVDWEDDLTLWHPVPRADIRVDRVQRTVELMGRSRELASGRMVRVRGANMAVALTTDSDTTSVNFEWICAYTAVQVLYIMREKSFDSKEIDGKLLKLDSDAKILRPKNVLTLRGSYWRLT
jgi:hypothetical protein